MLFIQHDSDANTEAAGTTELLDTDLHQTLLSNMLQLQGRKSTLTAISQCLVLTLSGISSCSGCPQDKSPGNAECTVVDAKGTGGRCTCAMAACSALAAANCSAWILSRMVAVFMTACR